MAAGAWDGFDHYGSSTDLVMRMNNAIQWTGVSGGPTTQGGGRNGNGKAWAGNLGAVLPNRVADQFIGISTLVGLSDIFFFFFDSVTNTVQVAVIFFARNYSIQIYRGNPFGLFTLLYASANNVFSANSAHFIEIEPKIDALSGFVKIKIDGEQVVNITGQNTQQSANAWWDVATMSGATLWDDFYWADTTTGVNNSFLGDLRSYTLWPTANSAVQFTPLANANWQEVSEVAFDGDVTYNFDSTVGHEDLFTMGQLPATLSGIVGLQLTGAYRKDDAGGRSMKNALKSSGTKVYGTTYALPDTSYAYFTDQWILDPNGSIAWTRTSLNAITAGYNLAA